MASPRAEFRRSYWKTVVLASGVMVVAFTAAVWLAQGGGGFLPWIASGGAALVVLLAFTVVAGGVFCLHRDANQERGVGWMPRARTSWPRWRAAGADAAKPRAGEWVEVRSAEEILGTLDDTSTLDALPFMPEMLAYCGMRFPVTHEADKILDMIDKSGHRMRRMRRAAFLDDLRCDGSAHDGCQQGCKIIWKTAWLRRVESGEPGSGDAAEATEAARRQLLATTRRPDDAGGEDPPFRCQATELLRASEPMHAWDPRPELRSLTAGNVRLGDFVLVLLVRAFNFAQKLRGGAAFPAFEASCRGRTPEESLELRPGEWVEVKSLDEIATTLDAEGRNRGMRYDREMVRFCGGRYRVRSRVDRLIDERTGNMLTLRNSCIILEGVEATGEFLRLNPQREYPYWREIWLRRIDAPGPDSKPLPG